MFSAVLIFPQHSDHLVEEKLEKVLREVEVNEPDFWDISKFIKKLITLIEEMNIIFKILFFLIIAALAAFIIYRLYLFYLKSSESNQNKIEVGEPEDNAGKNIIHDEYFDKAIYLRDKGYFAKAIIQLHLGTVDNLFNRKILEGKRDYTNMEITGCIKDKVISASFKVIADKAEQIVFNGKECIKEEYEEIEEIFRRNFL